jgi:hypothetical protein
LYDFDVYIFSHDLSKLYARLSLMLFIAPLINFSVTTSAPYGFSWLISTSGMMDVILGNCLIDVLDLILCRSLNSKSEKYFESATMLWSETHSWHT